VPRRDSARTEHILTAKQQRDKDKHGYFFGPRWDYTRSGKLTLTLHSHRLYGTRSSWSDIKRSSLEISLPKVMAGFQQCSAHLAALRIEDQERAHRHAIQKSREDRVRVLLQQRIHAVKKMVAGLERAKAIRACMTEVNKSGNVLPGTTKRLHRWAENLARYYDPSDTYCIPGNSSNKEPTSNWVL